MAEISFICVLQNITALGLAIVYLIMSLYGVILTGRLCNNKCQSDNPCKHPFNDVVFKLYNTKFQERSDFWRFDFVSRRWRPVKSKPGPGCLHSHCAVKFLSVMLLFGGEREGQTLNEMWRFHFG